MDNNQPKAVKQALAAIEFAALFLLCPILLCVFAGRLAIYLTLWFAGLYAFVRLRTQTDFSWRTLWHGNGWLVPQRNNALLRFFAAGLVLVIVTYVALPEKFMRFPLDRFPLWVAVMIFYPILSIIPQEIFFRSFYFTRFNGVLTEKYWGILINGALFGFSHIVLNNWIAPTCCFLVGTQLAHTYRQHRSLKWSVIEHSLYGCWVFTVGIGWYFFTGNWRH